MWSHSSPLDPSAIVLFLLLLNEILELSLLVQLFEPVHVLSLLDLPLLEIDRLLALLRPLDVLLLGRLYDLLLLLSLVVLVRSVFLLAEQLTQPVHVVLVFLVSLD